MNNSYSFIPFHANVLICFKTFHYFTAKIERFASIVKSFQPLTIFAKRSIFAKAISKHFQRHCKLVWKTHNLWGGVKILCGSEVTWVYPLPKSFVIWEQKQKLWYSIKTIHKKIRVLHINNGISLCNTSLNLFHANGLFLYSLNISENLKTSIIRSLRILPL